MLQFEDFPTHVRLMLLAARTQLREDEREEIRGLAAGELDWAGFLEVTAHHRVSALVFESMDAVRPQRMPAQVYEELQGRARANAFEALRAAGEMRRITDRLSSDGLVVTALKGVTLSQMLYGSANARHVGDLDLLVEGADVAERLPEQIALLGELGYERINPAGRLTPRRIRSYVGFWKDMTFANRRSGFELDLHWRLFNNRFHPANRVLEMAERETVTVFGTEMKVFPLQSHFVYAAAHGALDAWTYLKGLADVAAFLRRFTPDELDGALAWAEELGLLAQVSGAIHLANDWMGTKVRNARLLAQDEATAMESRRRTTAMLKKQNFRPVRDYPSPADWLRLEVALVPGMRSRLELARRFVWRPRVWSSIDLPDSLFWMYPVFGLLLLPRPHTVED